MAAVRRKANVTGRFPCEDYPAWLRRCRDVIRKERPDADIIFWTYNFTNAPLEARIAFVEAEAFVLCPEFGVAGLPPQISKKTIALL